MSKETLELMLKAERQELFSTNYDESSLLAMSNRSLAAYVIDRIHTNEDVFGETDPVNRDHYCSRRTAMPQDLTADQILDILVDLTPAQILEISEKFGPCQIATDLHNILIQIIYLQPQTEPVKFI